MNTTDFKNNHPVWSWFLLLSATTIVGGLIGGVITHSIDKYYEEKPTLLYQDNSKWKVTCFNSGNKVAKEVTLEVTFDKKIKSGSVTFFVPRDSDIESKNIFENKIFEIKINRLHSKFPENKDSKPEEIQIITNDKTNSVTLISLASDEIKGMPDPTYKTSNESEMESIENK